MATYGVRRKTDNILLNSPADSGVIYAGGFCRLDEKKSGLFRSTDGGVTWDRLLAEVIWDIDVHPHDSNIIYACSNRILKSVDKGETWFYADSGTVDAEQAAGKFGPLVMNPNQPDMLLVSQTFGLTIRTVILLKSENGGKSWQQLDSPPDRILTMDPFCDDTIYATSSKNIFKSKDFGETWKQWHEAGSETAQAYDMKIGSLDSKVFHIVARHTSRVYISKDGGRTWDQKNRGLPARCMSTH